MAIALDATSAIPNTVGTSATVTHTCTGSNLILVVGSFTAITTDDISSITYPKGGVTTNLTKANSVQNPGTSRFRYLFYMFNPDTGANTLTINYTTSSTIGAVAASYTGVSQSAIDAQNTQTAASPATTITSTLNTVANNAWKICFGNSQGFVISAGTNVTSRGTSGGGALMLGDSNSAITPAGAFDMTFTDGANATDWCVNVLTIAPVAAAAPTSNLTLLGVG